jgi:hypothetical protein
VLAEDQLPKQDGHVSGQRFESYHFFGRKIAALGSNHRSKAEAKGESVKVLEHICGRNVLNEELLDRHYLNI